MLQVHDRPAPVWLSAELAFSMMPIHRSGSGGAATLTELPPSHEVIGPWRAGESADTAALVPSALDVHLDGPRQRIAACGELDSATTAVLVGVMTRLIDLDPGDSTVDISGVTFLDASGLGALVGFNTQLAALGAQLSVAGATPTLRGLFAIVGLSALLECE